MFSLVVLMAHALHPDHLPTRQAAWYPKAEPTFVDALASVRRYLWAQLNSPTPPAALGSVNVPPVSDRGLLRSCPRWTRPAQKFVSQVQDIDSGIRVSIENHATVDAGMNAFIQILMRSLFETLRAYL